MHALVTAARSQNRLASGAVSELFRDSDMQEAAAEADWLVGAFESISLAQLNANAAMLERRDNKYVVRAAQLRLAIAEMSRHFDILEIDGKRDFTYETCYFDDPAHTSYFDHHRGRRRRCKVRIRKYVDSALCFVEIKLKDKRGITVKKRLDYPVHKSGVLDARAWVHIRSAYRALYGIEFTQALQPVLQMRYRRMTLVARQGGERMTIDHGLVFSGPTGLRAIGEGVFVIETKSGNANGLADKILRSLHQHPTRRCSKYCVGMAALCKVEKHNNFLPALRKLDVVPVAAMPAATVIARNVDKVATHHVSATPGHGTTSSKRGLRMRTASLLTSLLASACLLATPACGASKQDAAGTTGQAPSQPQENAPVRPDAGRFNIPAANVAGIGVNELSGMAWDDDEQLLYAVSDKGYVYHFKLKLDGDAIVAVDPVYAAALTDANASSTARNGFNAEGLAVQNAANGMSGDTELVVSLEGKPPGIIRFTPKGVTLGELAVPAPANDLANYRKKGQGLEAIAFHPVHGVMTAPESPLLAQPENQHTLYAKDGHWSFARHSPDSRLKAIDVLPDGNLLALERSKGDAKGALIASVRKVDLAGCAQGGECKTQTLAVLPVSADNFEGMTLVGRDHLLLVSDNGGKAQSTTLVLLPLR